MDRDDYRNKEDEVEVLDKNYDEDENYVPDRYINGAPIYYTTSQVAEKLNENPSTIRYWCDEFEQYLKVRKSGRNRMFTKLDIEKLEYIRELLKGQNLTIRQVKEFLSTPEAMVMQPFSLEKDRIYIAAIGQIITNELDRRFNELQSNLMDYIDKKLNFVDKMDSTIKFNNMKVIEEIQEQIQKEFEKQIKKDNDKMTEIEKMIIEREERLNNYIAEKFRQTEPERPKSGFFSRLFGK